MALEANVLQTVCENKGKSISAQTIADTTGYNALFIGAPFSQRISFEILT